MSALVTSTCFLCVAVSKAYKLLEDEEQLHYCKEIVEEAKVMVEIKVSQVSSSYLSLSRAHTRSSFVAEGEEESC